MAYKKPALLACISAVHEHAFGQFPWKYNLALCCCCEPAEQTVNFCYCRTFQM